LTESQVIAAVSGFAASLSLVLIDALVSVVSGKTFKTLFMYMSFNNRYHGFTIGIIDFSNVVFFLSIAALFVLLTGAGLEKRRWS
jgi:ABC-2 type transport system permease protein